MFAKKVFRDFFLEKSTQKTFYSLINEDNELEPSQRKQEKYCHKTLIPLSLFR